MSIGCELLSNILYKKKSVDCIIIDYYYTKQLQNMSKYKVDFDLKLKLVIKQNYAEVV